MDVPPGDSGTASFLEEVVNNKRLRTLEENDASTMYKENKEAERLVYMDGRIDELVKIQENFNRENKRRRECEIKLAQWQTKIMEREHEIHKLENHNYHKEGANNMGCQN